MYYSLQDYHQTAFQEDATSAALHNLSDLNRAVSDSVLITHEIIHYLRKSGEKKHVSMSVKTDMSKAYNRI